MDQVVEPDKGTAASESTFAARCKYIDEIFQQQKLSVIEIDVPNVGLYTSKDMPLAHVKEGIPMKEQLLAHMKVRWSMVWMKSVGKFQRELVQELTRPVNLRLFKKDSKNPGFSYKIKTKENVVITRLLVDIKDVEDGITQLMNEANRFYILYCFPAS